MQDQSLSYQQTHACGGISTRYRSNGEQKMNYKPVYVRLTQTTVESLKFHVEKGPHRSMAAFIEDALRRRFAEINAQQPPIDRLRQAAERTR